MGIGKEQNRENLQISQGRKNPGREPTKYYLFVRMLQVKNQESGHLPTKARNANINCDVTMKNE